MREILFKAKRVEDGEWAEGYYAKVQHWLDDHEMHIIMPQYTNVYPYCEFTSYDEIRPETLGLFTGFFDKNGKRIFEGDIIRASVDWTLCGLYEEVALRVLYDVEVGGFNWLGVKMETAEVIGNIHDNPELLEK